MVVDGQEEWLPLKRAGVMYDWGLVPVQIGGLVLDGPGQSRDITDEERTAIADIADEWSANK